jgi:hypothetical protein
MTQEKLVAVAFGDDGFSGDSSFYPENSNAVPATDESTFEELLAAYHTKLGDEHEVEDKPVGFWVLTSENLEIAMIPFDGDIGNDSACYAANRAVKRICNRLAVRIVGDASPLG